MLNTILQALDLTSLEGLAFPLVEINPYPNIYSKTVESGGSLNGMPTKLDGNYKHQVQRLRVRTEAGI